MSTSDAVPGPLPPTFRRLVRNDTHQTNDQWKQNLLRETGATAPLWTACALAGAAPTVDIPRPLEPLKPSDPGIMAELKGEYRQALSVQMGIPIAEVPEVSSSTIWERYAIEKGAYDDKHELYKIRFKEVNETFPLENRKVFALVEKSISEASVDDIKRTPDGLKAYEARDAFAFLQLAMELHDYVPAQISDRACQNAQLRFEGYRQPASASIAEHLNEFRRRLDYYCKVRGDRVDDVYKDYQLKGLLLASLYPDAWGEWHRIRQLTSTMPATFEGVENALREEESARALSALKDPYGEALPSAAHATSTTESLPPSCCSDCGASFCPKRPSHHRCSNCQKKAVMERKKRRDTGKVSSVTPTDSKSSRKASVKTAHDTVVYTGDPHEPESDEQPPWASYSTTVTTALASTAAEADYVIFDPASNAHVIRDRTLAVDINNSGPITRVRGSVPGCIEVREHGLLGDMGTGPVSTSFTRNLISESAALAAGYHVVHDTRTANEYRLIKEGRPPLIFRANREGTYSMPISDFKAHFPLSYGTAHHDSHATDVDRTQVVYTKQQRARADLYRQHHATCLAHAHDERIIAALENGTMINAPYTPADIRNAAIIHGPCETCLRAKGTRHRQTGHYPHQPTAPGQFLAGDLFAIMGVLFYMITCRMVNLRIVIKLRNKSASQIMSATGQAIGIWKGFGASPSVISWDQEPAIVASSHEIWSKYGVRMDFTPPDGHEKVAERNVRTIKEHVYASVLQLGHVIDDVMLEGIVRDTVTLLNFLPTANVDKSSPRTILDGERLNFQRWSRFSAGQVGEFEVPYPDKSSGARKELGYILCHQGDNAVVRLLPSGRRAVVRSAHFTPLDKSPAIVKLIEDGISEAQRARFNDLLAEIAEHRGVDVSSVGPHAPLPVTSPEQHSESRTEDPANMEDQRTPPDDDFNFFGSPPAEDTNSAKDSTLDVEPVRDHDTDVDSQTIRVTSPPPSSPPLRRSQRAAARKPAGFYAEGTTAESVRDYIACHMSARECAETYGKEVQEAAGAEEVINIIGRDAALPRDFRHLTPEELESILPSFLFYKGKDLLPSETNQDNTSNKTWTTILSKRNQKILKKWVKVKGRWVGGGHKQKKHQALQDRVAPTARATTHAIVLAIAAKEKRPLRVGDIPSAYLQAKHEPADGKPTFIRADKETTRIIVKVYPDLANYVMPNGTMILEVAKALYGLVESAWLWYRELAKTLSDIGYTVTEADRGLFVKKIMEGDKIVASNIVSVHVDDLISAASPNAHGTALSNEFWNHLESKWPGIKLQEGPTFKHLSWDIMQDPKTGVVRRSQSSYIKSVLKSLKVEQFEYHPMRANLLTHKPPSKNLGPEQHSQFRSILQKVAYAREGRPDIDFVVSHLQRLQTSPTQTDWDDLMHLLRYLNKEPEHWITHGPSDLQLRAYVDASYNITPDGNSHYGFLLTVGHSLVGLKGGRIKTVVRSSTEAEIVGVNEVTSEILWARDVLIELGFPQDQIMIAEDNASCITMLQTEPRNFQTNSRHVRVKWAFFRQEHEREILKLVFCPTERMRADLLTKPLRGKVFRDHDSAIREGRHMKL